MEAKKKIEWLKYLLKNTENSGIKQLQLEKIIPIRDAPDAETQLYKTLCQRSLENIPISGYSNLYCYFKTNHPFLKLAPIKVEIIHFDPLVVIFRNIISDGEIDFVKNFSLSKVRGIRR